VGDPFKDTSSVAMNPIIKFATLFGLLAVELSLEMPRVPKVALAIVLFLAALAFVYRSFYGMRIETAGGGGDAESEPDAQVELAGAR
jgi:K(+)-stimulated pyrophosphate-energized sodium pump